MTQEGTVLRCPHGRHPWGRSALAGAAVIAVGLCLGWSLRPVPPAPALRFRVSEETLDETGRFSGQGLAMSPDGRHVAWGRHQGSTGRLVVDGTPSRTCGDLLQAPCFATAPGSGLYAYVAQRDGLQVVVWGRVGGKEVESRGYLRVSDIVFSADGEHLAWLVSGDDWMLGAPGDRETFVVVDGLEGPSYARVWDLAISPHGDRVAYGAGAERPAPAAGSGTSVPAGAPPGSWRCVMVIDGREGPSCGHVTRPIFSPDGRRLAYTAYRDRRQFLVVDGVEGPAYKAVNYERTVFSPDGRRVAYGAQRGDESLLVLDGVEGPAFRGAGKSFGFGGPVFSPDSRRVAYVARRGEKWVPVVDGVAGTSYAGVWGLQFSPDSRRLVYTASRRARNPLQPFVVLDGTPQRRYAEVSVRIFSPDSQHLAYAGRRRDGHWQVIVDGQEAVDLGAVENGTPLLAFTAPDSLAVVCVRQGNLQRVVVEMQFQGGTGAPQ
jgi:hypothetical protein